MSDIKSMKILLENGADPNIVNKSGAAAIHYASGQGDTEAVKLLLAFQANPNIRC